MAIDGIQSLQFNWKVEVDKQYLVYCLQRATANGLHIDTQQDVLKTEWIWHPLVMH